MIAWSGHATSVKQEHHLHHVRIAPNMTFRVNTAMRYTASSCRSMALPVCIMCPIKCHQILHIITPLARIQDA